MTLKVLFIDDEKNILKAIERKMSDVEYKTLFADNGKDALELIEKDRNIAVIVSDIRMPEIDGIEIFEKTQKLRPDIVKIALSGYSEDSLIINAINKGYIYQYLLKPCDMNQLKLIINEALELYQLKKERQDLLGFLSQKNQVLSESNKYLENEIVDKIKQIVSQKQEVNYLNEQLKQEKTRKKELLCLLTHELTSPIHIISSFCQILLMYDEIDPDEQKQYLKNLNDSSLRLNKLYKELLYAVKLDSKKLTFEKERVDIIEIIENILERFQILIVNKKLDVEIICEEKRLFLILGDYKKIDQAIEKVISNAIKFNQERGKITIKIEKDFKENNEWIKISIKDTGIGIKKNMFEKIFDNFKMDEDIINHSNGLGLGLSIAKQIIEKHNGKIEVESEIEKGSTFIVLLPLISGVNTVNKH